MHRLLIDKRLFILRRVAFLGCVTALATLAWLPANTIARTALGGQVEHLIAYLGTTIVVGMAYPTHPRLAAHSVLLIGYAAILEVGQLGAQGRHASFGDFAFSAAGVAIGGLCLWMARARRARPIAGTSLKRQAYCLLNTSISRLFTLPVRSTESSLLPTGTVNVAATDPSGPIVANSALWPTVLRRDRA